MRHAPTITAITITTVLTITTGCRPDPIRIPPGNYPPPAHNCPTSSTAPNARPICTHR